MFNIVILLALVFGQAAAGNWAVLIAGSSGFWNYRHQADIAHAYSNLIKGGFHPANIITFMYDDVAHDPSNPFPGKLFNQPSNGTGRDVYAGINIDYKGQDVTPDNFVGALTGKAGKAGAKVLKSGPEDNVFVYFSDHGGPGLIAFPSGDLLAPNLISALTEMHTNKMYKRLVFYLEACESGSMFDNLLKPELGIYAVTAANDAESSWGFYCPPNDYIKDVHMGSCLGDLFSISWMEDVDVSNVKTETLDQQFNRVKTRTNLSHVSRFGDMSYKTDFVGNYITAATQQPSEPLKGSGSASSPYDAKLNMLNWRVQVVRECRCNHPLYGNLQQAMAQRDQELMERGKATWVFSELWSRLTGSQEGMMTKGIPTTNYDCLAQVRDAYRRSCGPISDFAQQYARTIVNLCETGHATGLVVSTLVDLCQA